MKDADVVNVVNRVDVVSIVTAVDLSVDENNVVLENVVHADAEGAVRDKNF